MTVRLNDGVTIELATGETFVADAAAPAADINFVSHAHGDHLYDTPPRISLRGAFQRQSIGHGRLKSVERRFERLTRQSPLIHQE